MFFIVFFVFPCIFKIKIIAGVTCSPRTPASAGGALPPPGLWAGPPAPCGTDDWLAGLSLTASRPRSTSHDAAHHGGWSAAARARGSAGLLPLLLLRGGGGGAGRREGGKDGASVAGAAGADQEPG